MSAGEERARGFTLAQLQHWLQTVITHPGGARSGVASVEARGSTRVGPEDLETVVAPSATLSGVELLDIYGRSYRARLIQCLREMFPALLRALGEEVFDLFALDYLQRHPPRSYTLDRLPDAFAEHLAETRPDAAAPPTERESWPDFIIELALIEWAFLKIYDGPGLEGVAVPSAESVLVLGPEHVLALRPAPAPCLRLFAFRYPVHAYMLSARRGERPELPAPADTFVAATRRDYSVMLHELTDPQYALLKALDGRRTLGEALTQAEPPLLPRPPLTTVQGWLHDWLGKAFFEAV